MTVISHGNTATPQRHVKHIIYILALLLALVPSAFAEGRDNFNLPSLGKPGAGVVSQAELNEMGKQMLIGLRARNLILQDPLITHYVRSVGQRIAANSNAPGMNIHYYVIATPVINSFASPGNNVFIFTGLLLQTDNENELAGVIAHETAHVTQHHIASRIAESSNNGWKALAGILAGLVLAAATNNPQVALAATMGTQAAIIQHGINFTRHEEAVADRMGIRFMAHAGYNPDGMAQMFQKMEILARGTRKPPAFLLNHPLNSARITDARERARQLPAISHPDSRSYLLMRARAHVLTAHHYDKVLTYFKGIDTDKLTKTARHAIIYGRALCLTRLNRAQDALALLKPLLAGHPNVIAYHLAVAKAELKRDHFDDAIKQLARTRRIFPDSLAVNIAYAHTLLAAGHPEDAKNVMETALIDHPHDPQILHILARAASRSDDTAEGRYYLSQYYELNGQLMLAIKQIQLALGTPDISDYAHARYQARLDTLKQAYKDRPRHHRG